MSDRTSDLPKTLRSILRQAEASYPDLSHRLWEVWEDALGAEVAGRSFPRGFRAGRLTVGVSSAAWMQQLGFLREPMKEALNRALGSELVRDIRLQVATPEPQRPPRAPDGPPPWFSHSLDPATEARLAEEVSSIADPDLRASALRARVRAAQASAFRADREAPPPRECTGRKRR